MFDADKTRMIGLPYGEKNYDNMLSRFQLIPKRHGQTDRRMDGRTDRFAISITCVSILIKMGQGHVTLLIPLKRKFIFLCLVLAMIHYVPNLKCLSSPVAETGRGPKFKVVLETMITPLRGLRGQFIFRSLVLVTLHLYYQIGSVYLIYTR